MIMREAKQQHIHTLTHTGREGGRRERGWQREIAGERDSGRERERGGRRSRTEERGGGVGVRGEG